jgi:NAD kinase
MITIGGDGTILYGASLFQKRQVPAIISFEKVKFKTRQKTNS